MFPESGMSGKKSQSVKLLQYDTSVQVRLEADYLLLAIMQNLMQIAGPTFDLGDASS